MDFSTKLSRLSRRDFVHGVGALVASAALTGCGAYDNAASGGSKGSGSGSSQETTKISFCLDYTPNTNHTGIYVAQDKADFNYLNSNKKYHISARIPISTKSLIFHFLFSILSP